MNENEGSEKQYERIFEDTDLQHKQHGGRKTYAGTVNSSKDASNTTRCCHHMTTISKHHCL